MLLVVMGRRRRLPNPSVPCNAWCIYCCIRPRDIHICIPRAQRSKTARGGCIPRPLHAAAYCGYATRSLIASRKLVSEPSGVGYKTDWEPLGRLHPHPSNPLWTITSVKIYGRFAFAATTQSTFSHPRLCAHPLLRSSRYIYSLSFPIAR